jgi:hypothetical protein
LEIWDEACRVEEDKEETDVARTCEEVKVSLVGLRVVATDAEGAIVGRKLYLCAGRRRDRGC